MRKIADHVIKAFTGKWFFLSNFEPTHEITAEHVFQAMKGKHWSDMVYVLMALSPGEAKRRGRQIAIREDWDDIRLDVMKAILDAKFRREPFKTLLLGSGDDILVEGNTWGDRFWGQSPVGHGQNHLGKILMTIRDELKATEAND